MAVYVSIGGTQMRDSIAPGGIVSVSVSQSVANRNTAEVVLTVIGDSPTFSAGQQVDIGNGATRYFVGTIQAPRRDWLNPIPSVHHGAPVATRWTLPCVSFDQIASRRIVETTLTYENQTAGAIMRDIATQFLGGENLGVSGVQNGPTVATFTVEAGTVVYAAFDAIAELAGMFWDILGAIATPELRLYSRGSLASLWSISEATAIVASGGDGEGISLTTDRRDVANDVFVELQNGPGSPTSQDFLGDGSAREFSVDKPIDSQPQIFVDGVEQAVALKDYVTSHWYWSPGSATVEQDPSRPVLTGANLLSVHYTPRERIVVRGARDLANIAARQAVEATSGTYQIVIAGADGSTVADGTAAAVAYLAAHKDDAQQLTVRSLASAAETLEIGQTIAVNLPKVGAVGTFFCEAVTRAWIGRYLDSGADAIMHTFTLSSGAVLGDAWTLLASAWGSGGNGSASGGGVISGGISVTVQDLGTLTGNVTPTPTPAAPSAGDFLLVTWEFGASVYTLTWGSGFYGTAKADYRARVNSRHLYMFIYTDRWDLLSWRTDI